MTHLPTKSKQIERKHVSGPKSITLFAPTDKAFAALSPEDLTKTVTDPALAKELVMKHLINGALYTNGMRYYQVKDSLQKDSQITISKHSGKLFLIMNFLRVSASFRLSSGLQEGVSVLNAVNCILCQFVNLFHYNSLKSLAIYSH